MDNIEKAFKEHDEVRATLAEHLIWPDDLAGLVQVKQGLELLVSDAEGRISRLVSDERAKGSSWATIGAMLGVSKQAAQQRYATTNAEQLEAMAAMHREIGLGRKHWTGATIEE